MLCLSGFELYSRWVPLKRRYNSPTQLTTPENTITCHNALCLTPQNFA